MYKFDEKRILEEHNNGLALVPEAEEIVDEICSQGYSNVFYLGIGGTVLYAGQFLHIARQLGTSVPFYLQNAADYVWEGNASLTKDSVVVIESVSGDTKEVVEAVEKIKKIGARVIGYIEKKDAILDKMCDNSINTTGAAYYFWYTVTLRFIRNAGEFALYDKFFAQLKFLPENLLNVQKLADKKAQIFAETYKDEPLTYLVASGNLEDWAVCEGMCIMEEMLWMPTRPISAANFFHGTLEVIERDVPMVLMKGEDCTRPQMDRVEKFANTICAKVSVFDTADYPLEQVDAQFRGLLSPLVMRAVFQRVNIHLECCRRHPMEIRRYYRRLNY